MRGRPGAALDRGAAHKGFFGKIFYAFAQELHFSAIDNAGDNASDNVKDNVKDDARDDARDAGEKIGAEPFARSGRHLVMRDSKSPWWCWRNPRAAAAHRSGLRLAMNRNASISRGPLSAKQTTGACRLQKPCRYLLVKFAT